jgi:hypothetical protein
MRVGLIAAAHHQLHAPVILIWDNLNTHISTVVRNLWGSITGPDLGGLPGWDHR